jgi:hypothetical protein
MTLRVRGPGGSGMYQVTVTSVGEVISTKAARYSLDDGGFDLSVAFVAAPFQTQFVDHLGNPITVYDFGSRFYGSGSDGQAVGSVYLKRISDSATAQTEGIKVQSNSLNGSTNGVRADMQGTLADSAVVRVPVFITVEASGVNNVSVLLVADHGIAPLEVRVNWEFEAEEQPENTGQIPLYGYVNTPYGEFLTSDPNLIGTFVTNPSWSGSTGGSIVTGNNA